jgi:integrase
MAKGSRYPGVYPYELANGERRWRCTWTASDARTAEWAYGFTSASAANTHRSTMIGEAQKGQRLTGTDPFDELYIAWLRSKRSITQGTRDGYEHAFIKRLRPTFGATPVVKMTYEVVDEAVSEWDECGDWAPKTINNTIGALSSFLTDQVKAGRVTQNVAQFVDRVLDEDVERDWLREREIEDYLAGCSDVYRPVGEFLIETGVRISEALAIKLPDLDFLDDCMIHVMRTRRDKAERERGRRRGGARAEREGATKGKTFRPVLIGPEYAERLKTRVAMIAEMAQDPRDAYLFQMPKRDGRHGRGRWLEGGPMDRNTISRNWHKDALADAGLRDMPLHSLRHTAAALWLRATGDMEFVRRQLGHAQITTTQRIYGHVEQTVMAQRAAEAERARRDGRRAIGVHA